MSPLQLKIIFNACKIRVSRGEEPEEVVDSYEKLTSAEKQLLYDELISYLEGGDE